MEVKPDIGSKRGRLIIRRPPHIAAHSSSSSTLWMDECSPCSNSGCSAAERHRTYTPRARGMSELHKLQPALTNGILIYFELLRLERVHLKSIKGFKKKHTKNHKSLLLQQCVQSECTLANPFLLLLCTQPPTPHTQPTQLKMGVAVNKVEYDCKCN